MQNQKFNWTRNTEYQVFVTRENSTLGFQVSKHEKYQYQKIFHTNLSEPVKLRL